MSYFNSYDSITLPKEFLSSFDNTAIVMLIGETGTGKSTLINYLYNYFNNGTLNTLKTIIPSKHHRTTTEPYAHHELSIDDNTQSKTNNCMQYAFTDKRTHKQYIFVDTPGLSDTRGSQQNDTNINKILDTVTQLGSLTSIVIVVNGSVSRLTASFRSALSCLNGNIPDIILEHVIVILTNSTKLKSTFDFKILNLNGDVYPFYMQNDAFVSDPRTWTKSTLVELENDWNHSMTQIKLILKTIDSFKQMSIEAFIQMREIRNDVKSMTHQTRIELMQIQKIQEKLAELELESRQARRDLVSYTDYADRNFIEKILIIDGPFHSTLCATCNKVCHNRCHLNEAFSAGSQVFLQCSIMKDGRCQACPKYCSYRQHYHAKKTIRETRESIRDVLLDLQAKYGQVRWSRSQYNGQLPTKLEVKELLRKALNQNFNDLKEKSMKLSALCSSFNLAEEFKIQIAQLKIESDSLRNTEAKIKLDDLIKILTNVIQYLEEKQEQKRQRQRQSSMRIIYQNTLPEMPTINVKQSRTAELVDTYRTATDSNVVKAISNELHRRAEGKSSGPLITPNEVMMIHDLGVKYQNRTLQDLILSSRRIQQRIEDIIRNDIVKILDVNLELLLENFIVRALLDKIDNGETTQHEQYISTSMPSPPVASANNSCSVSPHLKNPESTQPLPYPRHESMPAPGYSPSPDRKAFGFSHFQSVPSTPYPVHDAPLVFPPLPVDYSPIAQKPSQQSKTLYGFEALSRQHSPSASSALLSDNQECVPIPMPMPVSSLPVSVPVDDSDKLTNNPSSRDVNRQNYFRECSSISEFTRRSFVPDIVPVDTDFNNSSTPLSYFAHNVTDTHSNRNSLPSHETARLLVKYVESVFKFDEARRYAILEELRRRCYGDYPALVNDHQALYNEKVKLHEKRQLHELLKIREDINRKITEYLPNEDVTMIENIPVELIVEANALTRLIELKGST